ncbi:uncharacterized protein LOC120112411 [Phoenix dactylifera]|uniref:Uncharacterized protein LOC120112411 n=1 Tax=Phoenix dactylifera TaxID=42345 RepID=A0A8B9AWD3_PHODC|nr:uncharacterized protein LOC120112411 [Phoenix dactylifera]
MANASDPVPPEKFNGNNFKRWRQKMEIFLTTLGLFSIIFDSPPNEEENEPARTCNLEEFKKKDYLCRGRILSYLTDPLFDVYCTFKTSKEIWDDLNKKYGIQDAGMDKYAASQFLSYKMVDTKPVVDQAHELTVIYHELGLRGMGITESLQVACTIDKLPPSWKDIGLSLKHKTEDMTMKTLLSAIRIQEQHLEKDNEQLMNPELLTKVNFVESQNKTHKFKNSKFEKGGPRNKRKPMKPKHHINKNDRKPICYNCGKLGHMARVCRMKKKKYQNYEHAPSQPANPQTNMVLSSTGPTSTDDRSGAA